LLWALVGEPTVHVEVAGDVRPSAEIDVDGDGLEAWLEQRLVEEGWAIGDGVDATIVLRVRMHRDALVIDATRGTQVESIALDDAGDALGRLELLHHATAVLDRLGAAETPAPVVAPATVSTPAPTPVVATPRVVETPVAVPSAPRPPIVPRLHARGGIVGRRAAIDPAISVGLRVGRARGPGARLELGLWPSRARGVAITEVPAMAGFGWMFALGPRVEIEPAVMAGVLIHGWRFDGIRRAAMDGNFEVPIEIAVRLGRTVRLAMVPSIGVAGHGVVARRAAWWRRARHRLATGAQPMSARADALPTARQEVLARVAQIYAGHRDEVFRLALRYGRSNRAWAEDVVHDVFVALCRVADDLEELDDVRGWLYRVTTNACLGRLRREAVRNNPAVRWLLGDSVASEPDPESTSAAAHDLRRVLARLDVLPPRERVVFCMLHLDGLRQIEIAEVLGVSKGQVSKLVKRAHERIRSAPATPEQEDGDG